MEKEKSNFLENVRAHRHKLERRMQAHMESDESASRNTSLKEMIACWFDMNSLEHKLENYTDHVNQKPPALTVGGIVFNVDFLPVRKNKSKLAPAKIGHGRNIFRRPAFV